MTTDTLTLDPQAAAAVASRSHIVQLAKRFIERSEHLGYKGKKRDDAALDFFCGAAVSAEITGNEDLAQRIGMAAALMISIRGFIAVKELAEGR